jgi:hypothetical protein
MEKVKMASWQVFQGFLNITGGGSQSVPPTIFKPYGCTLGQFKILFSVIYKTLINSLFPLGH